MDDSVLVVVSIVLLPILAFLPGIIGPWELWHSMSLMFLLGFGGLFFQWSQNRKNPKK
ncbi:MAG: hypothetical protein AAF490_16210 [Chloroflexota bacterium]